ncbi:hypothetical protein [Streptomyces sp. H27-C3]|uniref:hypothetical protein n=1 Tax=Streptomyces sp. H27-C3 TaxID=3046305 RepID=UPI0024B8B8F6|nr:hypothetical protein [Streptomyces sp. H27-C3]MDJ0465601.1 hypothetical protein [Streptomyces sp. H27-C3]
MKETVAIIGWVVGIQGALGVLGRTFGDNPWGLLQQWWEIPTAGYAALAIAGAALAAWGEGGRRKRVAQGVPLP